MHRSFTRQLHRFHTDQRGNVAILFALCSVVVLFAAGIGLDYARTVHMSDRMGAAADAATLAAGRALLDGNLSESEIKQMAASYVKENAEAGGKNFGTYTEPDVTVDRNSGTVSIDLDVRVPTTLTRLGGFDRMNADVSATAVFEQKDVEVAMALDVTGSMNGTTSDGERKIDALKAAFGTFVDKLLPKYMPDGKSVRIAVAPYSSGLNLGRFSNRASNGRSRDNCVIERTGTLSYSEQTVGRGRYFKVHEDQPRDIDGTEGRQSYTCPNAAIIPLTDDRDLLVRTVNGYRASGSTGGHLGIQWAWNLISERWGGFWGGRSQPAAYELAQGDNPKLIKAVILMTDGIFNTSFFNDSSAQQARALCARIKEREVRVFSIAFGNPPAQAKQTLEQCATPGGEYYADAADASQLEAALSKFAGTLGRLRLAQ